MAFLLIGLAVNTPSVRWLGVGLFVVCASALAFVGWLDDHRSLSSRLRFGVQIVAALIVIFGIGFVSTFDLRVITLQLGVFGLLLTLIWLVGMTNAYNFMDGSDGLVALHSVIAGIAWSIIGAIDNDAIIVLLGLTIATSCAGFLIFNWHPASIFMGDVASTFLGFCFACMPLFSSSSTNLLFVSGMLIALPFVLDTGITLARRAIDKENVFEAHRSHFYQRLLIRGWSHTSVAWLYAALTVACAAAAILIAQIH
jgi:UDP-N-acetylmuramyl pentapeptide phosphotransferase/UDP-N-acetylglucosamine-1-phosphate transferase